MHHNAPLRRSPAERARHVRRSPQLSIIDTDPGEQPGLAPGLPLSEPVTITQIIRPTGSRAPTLPNSTVTPQSADSSYSSTPVTTSQTPPPVVTPSSMPSGMRTTSSIKPTGVATGQADSRPVAAGAIKKSGGLSSGGIAGIVLTILLLIFGVSVFIMRKRFMSNRQKKRATWGGGILASINEKSAGGAPPAGQYTAQKPIGLNVTLPTPPASYNNPSSTMSATSSPVGAKLATAPAISATVRCTFIPSLPDELSITTGEIVRVLGEYDDGWALCANGQGEQGMVPLECLEKGAATPRQSSGPADWRNAQRASSLVSPGGTRY